VARVQRNEQERERLEEDADAAVDGRVVGERADAEPARDGLVLARLGLEAFLGPDLAHAEIMAAAPDAQRQPLRAASLYSVAAG